MTTQQPLQTTMTQLQTETEETEIQMTTQQPLRTTMKQIQPQATLQQKKQHRALQAQQPQQLQQQPQFQTKIQMKQTELRLIIQT